MFRGLGVWGFRSLGTRQAARQASVLCPLEALSFPHHQDLLLAILLSTAVDDLKSCITLRTSTMGIMAWYIPYCGVVQDLYH